MTAPGISARIVENPFYVLGLKTSCTRQEVEREGQKWLSMLALSLKEAATYQTPMGTHDRTAELVRQAMSDLRDPRKRLMHELLAALPAEPIMPAQRVVEIKTDAWVDALHVFGYAPKQKGAK